MNLPEHEEEQGEFDKAFQRALKFVQFKPRSSRETDRRLMKWGYNEVTRGDVIACLEELGFLNDRDYTRVYLDEMVRKGLGRRRVQAELVKRGIPREIIDESMEEYPHDAELNRAIEAAESVWKRYKVGSEVPMDIKLVNYLLRKGFSGEVARMAASHVRSVDTNYCQE